MRGVAPSGGDCLGTGKDRPRQCELGRLSGGGGERTHLGPSERSRSLMGLTLMESRGM